MNDNLFTTLSEETSRELEKASRGKLPQSSGEESLRRDFLAEDFHKRASNIYEAIIIMSKRARQLGQRQGRIIEQFMASKVRPDDDEEEEEHVRTLDDDDDEPRLPKFEKPTILAMNEMHKGDIKYDVKE
ncbi:hypothetical protein CEE37_06965 [candidate division LCP-89 bacterium B3_LCP]|uniref:DNA-directed RNA polymerase subunit omega n=1 Tax=candidate division LCP-89 bacterium B3_LCP TaxID=2012998 RepID=A0A532V0J9_UNCL8|nr:MAG: hypothetical protein CEE37_06965 [candidate division LCP-89 bacterium B3_LCP]